LKIINLKSAVIAALRVLLAKLAKMQGISRKGENKMTNENETCEVCGQKLEYVRGYANGLSCPNAFLHENEDEG